MIPAPIGIIDDSDGDTVIAFDDDGDPLVLGNHGLIYTKAQLATEHQLTSVMPAAEGWRALFLSLDDGSHEVWAEPLVGWGVYAHGHGDRNVSGLVRCGSSIVSVTYDGDLKDDFWYYLIPGQPVPQADDSEVITEVRQRTWRLERHALAEQLIEKITDQRPVPSIWKLPKDQYKQVSAKLHEWDSAHPYPAAVAA